MDKPKDCNGLTIGEWTFDVFICDDGSLGFTVYERGKMPCPDATDIDYDEAKHARTFTDIFCRSGEDGQINVTNW